MIKKGLDVKILVGKDKNKTTKGFERPPVKKIIKASCIISAAITNVVEVSFNLLLIE